MIFDIDLHYATRIYIELYLVFSNLGRPLEGFFMQLIVDGGLSL